MMPNQSLNCITSVTPTLAKLMGCNSPDLASSQYLEDVLVSARSKKIDKIDKCLIFAPDAIGLDLFKRYWSSFDVILQHQPVILQLSSVSPSITPVCYASMFTGLKPREHGIVKKETPVLKCKTIFDVLIEAGKKVAIVTVQDSSIDKIFRDRDIYYFSKKNDLEVIRQTAELVKFEKYDFIVCYNSEYDDILHEETPFTSRAFHAMNRHFQTFDKFVKLINKHWQQYNRLIWFAPDHGSHIDPKTNKGTHGENIPEDMDIQHFIYIKKGTNSNLIV
jgi:hypothetical protein